LERNEINKNQEKTYKKICENIPKIKPKNYLKLTEYTIPY